MKFGANIRFVAACGVLCTASACDWNKEMDQEALGIVSGLFQLLGAGLWYFAIWVPLVVYYRRYFRRFFQDLPLLVQHSYAVGIGLIPQVVLTWPINSRRLYPWSAIGLCLLYAAGLYIFYEYLLEERERQRGRKIALEAERLLENWGSLPAPSVFSAEFVTELRKRNQQEGLREIPPGNTFYLALAKDLYEFDLMLRPETDLLLKRFDDPEKLLKEFQEPIFEAILEFRRQIGTHPTLFGAPAHQLVDIHTLNRVLGAFTWNSAVKEDRVHILIHGKLNKNALAIGERLHSKKKEQAKRVWPTSFEGTVEEAAYAYFHDTPLLELFTGSMSLAVSDETRFEGQWVVARQGSGKTQLLQKQIAADLKRVEAGEASIVVIDSQPFVKGGFLHNIVTLKQFAPGQPMADKLVFLRPSMQEDDGKDIITPALNVFDVGQHDPDLSARDRQIMQAGAVDMITFSLSGTSDPQSAMIRFIVQLAVQVPGITIDGLTDMLRMKRAAFLGLYGRVLDGLSKTVRDYFTQTFFDREIDVTKRAVVRRLAEIMSNTTFERMFSNERNAINLRKEIDAGKVIVIHTDIGLLGEEGCELFGRFFISLLLQATLTRTSKLPVFTFIDECHDYIANEEKVSRLIDQARKQKVAFTFCHQRLDQIKNANVLSALDGCAIKFASRNEGDSKEVARSLRTEEAFVRDMPKMNFACFIRDVTTAGAVRVPIKWGLMEEHMEHMSDAEFAQVRQRMRDLYCGPPAPPSPPPSPPSSAPRPPSTRASVTDVDYEIVSPDDDDAPDQDRVL